MEIHNTKLIESLYPTATGQISKTSENIPSTSLSEEKAYSFTGILSDSITNLDNKQLASDQAIEGLVRGKTDNLHNIMIKTSEAQLSLEIAVQLRNRAMEAMNEIKNMQF